jgi:hypothetical protein
LSHRGLTRTVASIIVIVLVVVAGAGAYFFFYSSKPLVTIRVGTTVSTPDPSDVPQWHAYLVDMKTLGYNVSLTTFTGQQAATAALLSGQIDAVQSSPAALLALIGQGSPILAVGVTIDAPDAVMETTANITTMDQLATQHVTVGITSLTDSSYYFPAIWLSAHGYNVNSVNWVIVPGAAGRTAALLSGKIPAGAIDVAGSLKVESQPGNHFHTLAYLSQLVPGFPQNLLFTTTTYYNSHQAELLALDKAMIMGHRWAQNKNAYMTYAQTVVSSTVTTDVLSATYDKLKQLGLWDVDCTWNVGIANSLATNFAKYQISGITSPPDPAVWAKFDLYQQALSQLGPYTPS